MNMRIGKRCARHIGAAAVFAWACCVLSVANISTTYATSIHSSVDIKVVDHAGPIWVDYESIGIDPFGLPGIAIYEKFNDNGQSPPYWADVEIEVTIHSDLQQHHGGGFFDPFFNGFNKFLNKFFGGGGHGGGGEVDPNFDPYDVTIGIDKVVRNRTGYDWPDFRIELGSGLGDNFVPSTAGDGVYFVLDPAPEETTHFFADPPMTGGGNEADVLHWTGGSGQDHRDKGIFWFGVHVPAELFVQDTHHPEYWKAVLTLRQHAGRDNIPEPNAVALAIVGSLAGILRRRRRQNGFAESRLN